jgi:anaphase-promoting complex subunit 11
MEEPIKIKSINLFSSWVYNLPKNTDCTICRCNLNLPSLYNQEKGIDSYVVSGTCNHSFHYECIKPWVEKNHYCPICFSEWQFNKKPMEDPYTTLVDKIIINNDEALSIINDAQSIIDKYKNSGQSNKVSATSKKNLLNIGGINKDWVIHYNEDTSGINKIPEVPEISKLGPTGFSKKELSKSGTGTSTPTTLITGPSGPAGAHPCNCVTCTGPSININEYINEKIKNKFKTINIDL